MGRYEQRGAVVETNSISTIPKLLGVELVYSQHKIDELVSSLFCKAHFGVFLMANKKRLVVTVHGIRTFGGWQEKLEKLLSDKAASEEIEFLNYKYGYFSIVAFIVPIFRWLVVRRFRIELVTWVNSKDWDRIDFVGHSFGTHVLAWALHGFKEEDRPDVHTIILCGSVLRGSFPWRDLVGSSVERVVNDCGAKDNVLIINQFFVLFTGMAGRVGFNGATHQKFRNRYFNFGHSGYFYDSENRLSAEWMEEHWLPLFSSSDGIESYDERQPPSVFDGIMHTAANNAEPVKLAIYITPFLLVAAWIYGLYVREETARVETQNQTAHTLSIIAEMRSAMGRHAEAFEIAERAKDLANDELARRRSSATYFNVMNAYATDAYDLTIDELLAKHGGEFEPIETELHNALATSVVDEILLGTETFDRVGVRNIEVGQREVFAEIGLRLDELDDNAEVLLPEFDVFHMTLGSCDYRDEDIFQCAGAFSFARHKIVFSVGPFSNPHYLAIDEINLFGEIVRGKSADCDAGEEVCTVVYYTEPLLNIEAGDQR